VERIIKNLYKNQASVDTYATLLLKGDSVKKFLVIAILSMSAAAQASGGDCYMAQNCPGNPNSSVSPESSFSSSNMNVVETVMQVAQAMVTTPSESTFSALSDPLSTKTKNQQLFLQDPNDGVEQ
jgi:hypothetical protein